MQKKAGFAIGSALLVAGFVWIVFDNLALAILFGLIAGGAGSAAASKRDATDER